LESGHEDISSWAENSRKVVLAFSLFFGRRGDFSMTKVLSIRMPSVLERAIRHNADQSRMPTSDIVRLILMHAPDGQYSFSALPDAQQYLDAKLDVRLPEELVSRLRAESERLRISVSVYSRIVLYAYYTKRLVFVEIGDRYTLAENHEQTKSA
jgi:predicted DNA-binding protein